jgi:hypothetical protein
MSSNQSNFYYVTPTYEWVCGVAIATLTYRLREFSCLSFIRCVSGERVVANGAASPSVCSLLSHSNLFRQ